MLPDSIQLVVVTPERQALKEAVSEVQLPGADGYLGVLPGHAPLITELGIGELSYRTGFRCWRRPPNWPRRSTCRAPRRPSNGPRSGSPRAAKTSTGIALRPPCNAPWCVSRWCPGTKEC